MPNMAPKSELQKHSRPATKNHRGDTNLGSAYLARPILTKRRYKIHFRHHRVFQRKQFFGFRVTLDSRRMRQLFESVVQQSTRARLVFERVV